MPVSVGVIVSPFNNAAMMFRPVLSNGIAHHPFSHCIFRPFHVSILAMPFTYACKQCGNSFLTRQRTFNGKTPLFCSNVCKFASYRVRPKSIEYICPRCGLQFIRDTAKMTKDELVNPVHYCSVSCATIDRDRPSIEE